VINQVSRYGSIAAKVVKAGMVMELFHLSKIV
jgi:hypothetical protein